MTEYVIKHPNRDEESGLSINWKEAVIVQMIFEKYLQGYSILGLQRFLKEMSIPSPSGKDMWNQEIYRACSNK